MITLEEHIDLSKARRDSAYAWLNTYWGLRLVDAVAVSMIIAVVLLPTLVQ